MTRSNPNIPKRVPLVAYALFGITLAVVFCAFAYASFCFFSLGWPQ